MNSSSQRSQPGHAFWSAQEQELLPSGVSGCSVCVTWRRKVLVGMGTWGGHSPGPPNQICSWRHQKHWPSKPAGIDQPKTDWRRHWNSESVPLETFLVVFGVSGHLEGAACVSLSILCGQCLPQGPHRGRRMERRRFGLPVSAPFWNLLQQVIPQNSPRTWAGSVLLQDPKIASCHAQTHSPSQGSGEKG